MTSSFLSCSQNIEMWSKNEKCLRPNYNVIREDSILVKKNSVKLNEAIFVKVKFGKKSKRIAKLKI